MNCSSLSNLPLKLSGSTRHGSTAQEIQEGVGSSIPPSSDQERNVAEKLSPPPPGLVSKSSFVIGPDNTVHHVYDWLFGLGSTLLRLSRRLAVMGGSRWTGTRY